MSNNKKYPTSYVSPNVSHIRIFYFPRDPATTDFRNPFDGKNYGIGDEWQNKYTGDIFKLFDIVANVADWVLIGTGTPSLLNITVPLGITPVQPNGAGTVVYTSTGGTLAITGTAANTINFDLAGGGLGIDSIAVPAGTSPVVPTALGLVTLSVGAGLTLTGGLNSMTFGLNGGVVGQTITGDSGGALSPTAGNWNHLGQNVAGSGIITSGSGSTMSYAMHSPYSLGNFSFTGGDVGITRANAGASVLLLINNTSASASSNAQNQLVVTATGGNAWTDWDVSGVQAYAAGIDNTDDSWKLTNSNTFTGAGSTLIRAVNAGDVSILSGDLDVTTATATTKRRFYVLNNSTDSTSDAVSGVFVAGGSASDPYFQVGRSANMIYCLGTDTSDSDTLKIVANPNSNTATPSGTTVLQTLTSAGEFNLPLQPAFYVYLSATASNVTGDGTTYQIAFDTVSRDQGSDFTTGAGALFTAPVTGMYLLTSTVSVTDLDVAHTDLLITIVHSGVATQMTRVNPFPNYVALGTSWSNSIVVGMNAGNTAYVTLSVSGGAKIVDVQGTGGVYTSFSGALLC